MLRPVQGLYFVWWRMSRSRRLSACSAESGVRLGDDAACLAAGKGPGLGLCGQRVGQGRGSGPGPWGAWGPGAGSVWASREDQAFGKDAGWHRGHMGSDLGGAALRAGARLGALLRC